MRKTHYIPVTADVPGAASEGNCALIRKDPHRPGGGGGGRSL